MNVTIREEGRPSTAKEAPVKIRGGLDLQDALVVVGFFAVEVGVAAISWRAALILSGVLFFMFALMIERSKRQ